MENVDTIPVEVAYALCDRQAILVLEVAVDATVAETIRLSGILEQFPESTTTRVEPPAKKDES
jgi:putative ubiquitin-RnfH superfamily antitoxin RatB of RatAB toxin-antitoxin module